MHGICRNMSLSHELGCDAASLCRLHEAYQPNLSQIGKEFKLFLTFYSRERSKQLGNSFQLLDYYFFLLIFQPQI